MNIRMIHGVPPMECRYLGEDKILQLTEGGYDAAADCGLWKVSIYWGKENKVQEIVPEITKHRIGEFYFAETECSYVYFIHVESSSETAGWADFILYRNGLEAGNLQEVHRFRDKPGLYGRDKQLKIFVLNSSYLLLQFAYRKSTLDNTHEGYYDFEPYLCDMEQNLNYRINEEMISAYGIETIIPLEKNLCAVRIGYSQLNGGFSSFTSEDAPVEILGITPITQLISELVLDQSQLSMEVICSVQFYETIYGICKFGDSLIFSRVFRENEKRELVVFQWKSREIQRYPYNKAGKSSIPCKGYMIQDPPFLLRRDDSHAVLTPLDKKGGEIRLPNGIEIMGISGNLICAETIRKKLFTGKQETIYEVYQYPDMKPLIREKGSSLSWLEAQDRDTVYMFVSSKEDLT